MMRWRSQQFGTVWAVRFMKQRCTWMRLNVMSGRRQSLLESENCSKCSRLGHGECGDCVACTRISTEKGIEKNTNSDRANAGAQLAGGTCLRVFRRKAHSFGCCSYGLHQRSSGPRGIGEGICGEAKSVRADISAACSEGLVEVYSGLGDVGLSRGMKALEKARQVKPSLRETLLAMVQAHEKAGRPERALALHRELTLHIRKAQHENIVRHQELHLKQLEAMSRAISATPAGRERR